MDTSSTHALAAPKLAQQSAGLKAEVEAPSGRRLPAIDRLRGLVIVLMALDHVRDYFSSQQVQPTDLAHTTPALFLTRWITHFCAPIFIFLAGVSAALLGQRSSRAKLQRFLLTRGLWLVVLEFTVVCFVWFFNFRYPLGLVMQVIWATGVSMCVLAGLVALPAPLIAVFSFVMIAGHNLLDGIAPERLGAWAPWWRILHVPGEIPVGEVLYPLVPWVGVMAAGYVFGGLYRSSEARRRRITLALGFGLSAGFVLLRLWNGYGDPKPWSPQASPAFSVLSFINVTKYPPSLLYLLMTLGPGLLALHAFERSPRHGALATALQTVGRVPLFAYVVHLAIAHALAGVIALSMGFGTAVLRDIFVFYPANWGFGLGAVYLAWLVVLLLLYPLCSWFAALKRRRRDWWLSYL